MNSNEKVTFVNSLVESVRADIERKITDGSVPEDWDGHELRCYIARRFQLQVYPMDRKRSRDYVNTLTVSNL